MRILRLTFLLIIALVATEVQSQEVYSSTKRIEAAISQWSQDSQRSSTEEVDVGRWRWSKASQPWHYAAVEIAKGNVGGSGTCISVGKQSYVTTNNHVVGSSGTCSITWLRPHSGKTTTRGRVVHSGPGDQSLIVTTAPAWVRPIPVACPKCGDIAYKGTRLEVLGYGSSPRRGKDSLRHFDSAVIDYANGEIQYRSGLIGGDSGGSVISADKYWPRLHGINARSEGTYGVGPSDATVNKMLENYFGVARCTGKGECLPSNEKNAGKFFGRLFGGRRNNCGPDGCYPGNGGGGDGGTHPDHPGDREPPDWWGGGTVPAPTNPQILPKPDKPTDPLIQPLPDPIKPIDNSKLNELTLGVQRNSNALEILAKTLASLAEGQKQNTFAIKDIAVAVQRNSGSLGSVSKNIELLVTRMESLEVKQREVIINQQRTTTEIQKFTGPLESGQLKFRLWVDEATNKVLKVESRQ